jgi:hypothetical protein
MQQLQQQKQMIHIRLFAFLTNASRDGCRCRYKPRGAGGGPGGGGGGGPPGALGSDAGAVVAGRINWGHLAGDAKLVRWLGLCQRWATLFTKAIMHILSA